MGWASVVYLYKILWNPGSRRCPRLPMLLWRCSIA